MKTAINIFFLAICISFAGCVDSSSAAPTYVSPDGGALGQGWWLIPVIFGLLLPAWLIYNGYKYAQMGTYKTVDKMVNGRLTKVREYDNKPRPWYSHGLSIGGIIVFVIVLVITIARLTSFE